ncbi:MAG: tripartite tricarboxylate transporter substrate-binding protein [Deltaproteobacteria bacterium]|nr:tripartite tricarboxylate transporter substrate-binding protein [Deltaproteobacteria bacterium]
MLAVVLAPLVYDAHASNHEFYKGKTIRLVVGFSAGGGFDTYSRLISRHLGRHIPGNPTVIVENMTGAGSRIAASQLFKVARPDGLTMGNFMGSILLDPLLGRPGGEYDPLKFEYLGSPQKDHRLCVLTKDSGITSVEKWMASKTPVKLGGVSPGVGLDDAAKVLKVALGLPIQLVSGYKGTAEVRLAAESGEVAGACGWGWDSVRATWGKAIESGTTVIVLQSRPKPHPELPNIPLALELAKTEEARQLIKAGINDPADMNRVYALTPGTPKDRVQLLRKSFMDTMKDPEFLADAEKSKVDVDAVSGDELEATIKGVLNLDPAIVAKLKEILK